MTPLIAVINESTAWPDAAAQQCAAALHIQVGRDFAPVWGSSARVEFHAKSDHLPADAWWLTLLDDADQAGALGYHETTPTGYPLGKVFVRTTLQYGGLPSVTASHELLEMLGDPFINQAIYQADGSSPGVWYAREVCDACEDDAYSYEIEVGGASVAVSDFVTPEWFVRHPPQGARFDHRGHIDAPLKLLPGGYISRFVSGGWSQITGDLEDRSQYEVLPGSRRDRRLNREQWRPSVIDPFAREAPNG